MKRFKFPTAGNLDIIIAKNEDEFDGKTEYWENILIHGDQEGLRSLAKMLLYLADLDQSTVPGVPIGAREHYHLRPKLELSNSSMEVIVGRLDGNGTGEFYEHFVPKNRTKKH